MTKFITLEDGTVVPVAGEPDASVIEPEVEKEGEPESDVDDLSDLTQVDREDVLGKPDGNSGPIDLSDLTSLDAEDDMEDLFEYTGDEDEAEEVLDDKYPGVPASQGEEVKKPPRLIRRTTKPYKPTPQGLSNLKE